MTFERRRSNERNELLWIEPYSTCTVEIVLPTTEGCPLSLPTSPIIEPDLPRIRFFLTLPSCRLCRNLATPVLLKILDTPLSLPRVRIVRLNIDRCEGQFTNYGVERCLKRKRSARNADVCVELEKAVR